MLLSPDGVDRLREALTGAGFTATGIAERLGPAATSAVARDDFRAALRATAGGDPLDTLIRLFVCAQTEPEAAVAAAFAPLPLAEARAAGLVERARGRPAAGRRPGAVRGRVVGPLRPAVQCPPGPAAAGRPRARRRRRLHDAGRRDRPPGRSTPRSTSAPAAACRRCTWPCTPVRVTATDLSERALRFAATTAALNGQRWELLARRPRRAGRGPPVRPRGQQPAVRGRPGRGHPHLPRLRAGRRRGLRRAGRRRARPADRRRHHAVPGQLGARGRRGLGRPGRRLVRRHRPGRLGDPARGRRPGGVRRPVARRRRRDGRPGPDGRLAGLVRRAQGRGRRVRAGHAAHGRPRRPDRADRGPAPAGAAAAGRAGGRVVRPAGLAARARRARRCSPPGTGMAEGLQLRQEATMGDDGLGGRPAGARDAAGPALDARRSTRWCWRWSAAATARVPLRDQVALLAVAHEVADDELAEAAVPIVAHLVERGIVEPADRRAGMRAVVQTVSAGERDGGRRGRRRRSPTACWCCSG